MNIQQLSVTYQSEQDRILLRIMSADAQEIKVWFTRKLMLGLWPLLQKASTETTAQHAAAQPHVAAPDPIARQAIADFKRAESLQQADFKTPYQTTPKWMPLGTEPLLVTDVRLTPEPGGKLNVHWTEKLPERNQPRGFGMSLEQGLLHGLMKLLDDALTLSGWLQSADAADQDSASTAAPPADERPKYLN